ncbi:hypothetical protein LMG7141_03704 [Ralstonia condita]|uniref:Uncharacterized protein n=1 Tax=Ralstonia condita TaxID=3058600 RepID=A0ABM9JNU1_9RALS|nr:hypothetical protein LMG7141_03704 [Ralstonia sp. LMG 7141]
MTTPAPEGVGSCAFWGRSFVNNIVCARGIARPPY